MDAADIKAKIEAIMREEPRFAEEAYAFVANAVTFTVGRLPAHRHVSALELLGGVRDYAREEFGVLAYEVCTSGESAAPPTSGGSSTC